MIPSPEKCTDKAALYPRLCRQLKELIDVCPRPLPCLANATALLRAAMPQINWCGFYLHDDAASQLVLGPFQGKAACILIPDGKGVCGAASQSRAAQLVPDVFAFPGHIACDAASRSEIVLPLMRGCRLLGVLDIDSPVTGRFDEADLAGLTLLTDLLASEIDWDGVFY